MRRDGVRWQAGVDVAAALDRVVRLSSVGSKRFLTNKVDRSVTGLIAQQQCVGAARDSTLASVAHTRSFLWLLVASAPTAVRVAGPLHIPLADVGVIAQTHQGVTGGATAVGEQPIKVRGPHVAREG